MIGTGKTSKTAVKLTFAKSAALPISHDLFNASLDGATHHASGLHKGAAISAGALMRQTG